ncbi:MAG: hypothetical protein KUG74_03590 [Rhodobacteraceae bacterium]|nr:hypothetical protein [Paracoccaceae bacterium]
MLGFIAAIAAGFGTGHLGLSLLGQQQDITARVKASTPGPVDVLEPQAVPPAPWPDIFGKFEPDALPVPEPEPPVRVVSHSYILKGLFASARNSWAIVSDPGGEYLLRKGDELPGGALVEDISEEGVWLITAQGRELIAFGE